MAPEGVRAAQKSSPQPMADARPPRSACRRGASTHSPGVPHMPQQYASPVAESASEWWRPAATSTSGLTERRPSTSAGVRHALSSPLPSAPIRPLPQLRTRPSAVNASACNSPQALRSQRSNEQKIKVEEVLSRVRAGSVEQYKARRLLRATLMGNF